MLVMLTIKPTDGGFQICSECAYKRLQGQSACASVRGVCAPVRYKRHPKYLGVPFATPGVLSDAFDGEHPSESLDSMYDLVEMFDVSNVYREVEKCLFVLCCRYRGAADVAVAGRDGCTDASQHTLPVIGDH